jgi:hypothetical protein
MAHRLAPGAEVELDEIWLWTAKESGSVDIADRVTTTGGRDCGVFPWGDM